MQSRGSPVSRWAARAIVSQRILGDRLDAGRDIRVALIVPGQRVVVWRLCPEVGGITAETGEEVRSRVARGTEQRLELPIERPRRRIVKREIIHVELEAAIWRDPDQ